MGRYLCPLHIRTGKYWLASFNQEMSIYPAWRGQYLRRLAGPVFTPLGEPSIYTACRAQCLRRLVSPAFTPLGEPSIYTACRGQHLRCLAGPAFTPLVGASPTQYQFPETTIKDVRKGMGKYWALWLVWPSIVCSAMLRHRAFCRVSIALRWNRYNRAPIFPAHSP